MVYVHLINDGKGLVISWDRNTMLPCTSSYYIEGVAQLKPAIFLSLTSYMRDELVCKYLQSNHTPLHYIALLRLLCSGDLTNYLQVSFNSLQKHCLHFSSPALHFNLWEKHKSCPQSWVRSLLWLNCTKQPSKIKAKTPANQSQNNNSNRKSTQQVGHATQLILSPSVRVQGQMTNIPDHQESFEDMETLRPVWSHISYKVQWLVFVH